MHLPEKVNHFCWKLVFTCWESIHTLWWACWVQAWQGQSHSTQPGRWQASTTSAEGWPVMVASHPYLEPSNVFLKSAFHCSIVPASIAKLEINVVDTAFRATFAPKQAFNCCMADYYSCMKFQHIDNSVRKHEVNVDRLIAVWRGRQPYQKGCGSWHNIKSLI